MPQQPRPLCVEQLEPRDVPSAASGEIVPGHYIVTLRAGVDPHAFAGELQGRGRAVSQVYTHGLKGLAYAGAPLGFDPRIASVEPDRVVSIQGKPTSPPPPPPPAQVVPTGVARIGGMGGTGANYSQVNVAIIDTGIDSSHPDLNVAGGINFTSTRPQNWGDDNGHGTHVGGTVGARDNSIGVVGVAPGATLWAVKVLNRNGNGFLSHIIAGVNWVTATRTDTSTTNDIAVANMSLGVFGSSTALHNAIKASVAAGVVYAVAAMNASMDASAFAPAAYPEVITVSALADSNGQSGGGPGVTSYGADDTLATFSNYGAAVDIAAPGVDILSTLRGGGYGNASGTSMASPHVAGAAVRYIAAQGKTELTDADSVAAVRDALIAASQPMSDWGSGAVASDPDSFHEGLLYIRRDAAVTAIFLTPESQVSVTVANQSATAQTAFTVHLYDSYTNELLGTLPATGLGAGGSTTLTFASMALSGRTLRAEVRTLFDTDLLDNVSAPLVVG